MDNSMQNRPQNLPHRMRGAGRVQGVIEPDMIRVKKRPYNNQRRPSLSGSQSDSRNLSKQTQRATLHFEQQAQGYLDQFWDRFTSMDTKPGAEALCREMGAVVDRGEYGVSEWLSASDFPYSYPSRSPPWHKPENAVSEGYTTQRFSQESRGPTRQLNSSTSGGRNEQSRMVHDRYSDLEVEMDYDLLDEDECDDLEQEIQKMEINDRQNEEVVWRQRPEEKRVGKFAKQKGHSGQRNKDASEYKAARKVKHR